MLAARLHPGESHLRLEDIPVPEPHGEEVLVRVAGAGVCRSDLHVLDGEFEDGMERSGYRRIGGEVAPHRVQRYPRQG